MKLSSRIVVMLIGLGASVAEAGDFAEARLDNWHQWRGPHANGVAPNADPPVRWDESRNVKWKVEVPGSGADIYYNYRLASGLEIRNGNIGSVFRIALQTNN